jgi:glycosyltransferase involved in cell wall biosynthesis
VRAIPLEASPSRQRSAEQPLAGLRLVVTGLDLQQAEHRGIAVYSKALLRALRNSGAELWLLTDFDPKLQGASLRAAPAAARQLVFSARVLEALNRGFKPTLIPLASTKLARKSGLVRKALKLWAGLMELPGDLLMRKRYNLRRARRVDLSALYDNPYNRVERLLYLDDLSGIICARNVFVSSFRAALGKRTKPIRLQLGDFDGLVTTCPLHLSCDAGKAFVQTIHDLIPLEYVQTTDHAGAFSRRLESCLGANRLFVSSSTQHKYRSSYGDGSATSEAVVVQPPSLQMPAPYKRRLLEQDVLHPSRHVKARNSSLQVFRYVLFNSSVEPRKNLLFVIRAYRQSGLAEQGIRLCVTGQLKKDDYSQAVAEQADDSVLLTGYIDENTKTSLFLHALMVLSPSLVEGFGIPVLDAACVGAPVIASPSDSHQEIRGLHDFSQLVWICDTRDPLDWAIAMKDLAAAELAQPQSIALQRQQRLDRYDALEAKVFDRFRRQVCDQVRQGIRSETEANGARG